MQKSPHLEESSKGLGQDPRVCTAALDGVSLAGP